MADVLKVEGSARVRLYENGIRVYDQYHTPNAETYTEHTGDRLVLATNMTQVQEIDMGGVDTGQWLLLETSQTILVALDTSTATWSCEKALYFVGSFTHVYVQNENTTNTATVQVVFTD